MEIPIELKNDIEYYCKVNNIDNIDEYIVKIIKLGHTIEKYGYGPNIRNKTKNIEPIEEIKNEEPEKVKKTRITKKVIPIVKNEKKEDIKPKRDIYGE